MSSNQSLKWSETLYFLIDGKFYDLTDFIDKHPGGAKLLRYSKRYAYDQTTHFSMHHVNYDVAFNIMQKYLIKDEKLIQHCKNLIEKEQKTHYLFQKQIPSKAKIERVAKEYILNHHSRLAATNIMLDNDYDMEYESPTSESSIDDEANEQTERDCEREKENGEQYKEAEKNTLQRRKTRQTKTKTKTADGGKPGLLHTTELGQRQEIRQEEQQFTDEFLKLHNYCFKLPEKGSFYYDLRVESWKYFRSIKHKTGPKLFALQFWWFLLFLYGVVTLFNIFYVCNISSPNYVYSSEWLSGVNLSFYYYYLRILFVGILGGVVLAWLGGYGHQWSHMPAYRKHAHILDWIGLYSHTFRKEHLLLHHPYTNTITDNHFDGTEPLITINPLIKRGFIQKYCTIALVNLLLAVGVFGNWLFCGLQMIAGKEELRWFYWILPGKLFAYWYITQSFGCGETCATSYYYFLIALMNHNQGIMTWDLDYISKARDWGEFQLAVSCDIGYNYNWLESMLCLWLNYHTVHHLLPTTDMSHHRELQQVLTRVSKKHGIKYHYKPFWQAYLGLLETVSVATALKEIKNE